VAKTNGNGEHPDDAAPRRKREGIPSDAPERASATALREKSSLERIADGLRVMARTHSGKNPDMETFRTRLACELMDLIPEAVAQAKKGKPALLRLLARFR
jgi:hypothetical protein